MQIYSPIRPAIADMKQCELCAYHDEQDSMVLFSEGGTWVHTECAVGSGAMKRCGCWQAEWCDTCSGVDEYQQDNNK